MRRFHPRDGFIIVALCEQFDDPMWLFRRRPRAPPLGFMAIVVGWITTEIGRQPYVV